jgi:iron complex outermembrane recepter protein
MAGRVLCPDRNDSIVVFSMSLMLASSLSSAADTPPAPPTAQTGPALEEVVVTGTHFATLSSESPSPVAVIDSDELMHQGTSHAEDLLNSLPQTNAGFTLGANGAGVLPVTGTATLDLRGLGPFRTLVLMNGRRLNAGDPTNPSPDLNTVPTVLIKRVEVLTGGASSIYGSDAISGVVNFVMDTEFTGLRFNLDGHVNYASNDNSALQGIARASGVNPATGSTWDGGSVAFSAAYGTDLFAGDGHFTGYFEYNHTQAVLGSSRDFGACTLREAGSSYACLLDPSTPNGTFVPNGGVGPTLTLNSATGNTFRAFNPATDSFNPASYLYLQRPDTRYNVGFFGEYKFSSALNSYIEATFSDDDTTVGFEPAGTTPTGAATNIFNVNCNNPLLSASEVNALCTTYGLGPTDTAAVGIGRRNMEAGPLMIEYQHRSYRLVAGLKGPLSSAWSYDVSALYGNTNAHVLLNNDISISRLQNALTVVSTPGGPTCRSVVNGSDPNCVPYNPFMIGGVTPAAVSYITENGVEQGYARHWIVSGNLTGELDKYGLRSPLASEGFQLAAGADYRSESILSAPDTAYTSGDLLETGTLRPTAGTFNVYETFTELRLPLINDQPFAKRLNVDISDNYARYEPQGAVNAFKIGSEWAPVDLLRIRGGVSKSVRAPNGHELFLAQALTQLPMVDPCSGPTPAASRAACANTGVTAAEYGNIPAATTFNQLVGGNPNLKPEIADTFTAGIVLTPVQWAPRLVLSADYWRIRVQHFLLSGIPAGITFNSCLNGGDPLFCSLIHRDDHGSLSLGNGPTAGRIIASGLNTGSYGESGVDIDAHDTFDVGFGNLTMILQGTRSIDNPIQLIPGQPAFDCTGYIGPTCTGAGPTSPIPKWRHRLRTTWRLPSGFDVSLNWRHIGALDSEHTSSNPQLNGTVYPIDAHIPSFDYLDIDAGITLYSHLELRMGVKNLTDRQPPIVGYTANPLIVNGNVAAGLYDFLGRDIFLQLTANF